MLRKKLLLIILLIVGCAREYRCDAGPPCESDIETEGSIDIVLGTICGAIITVEWPDGVKEAEAECDEMYNNDPSTGLSCTCEKDN